MEKNIETSLVIVKDDFFCKIRKNLFYLFFKKENELLSMVKELEKPKNKIGNNIIIPKELKGYRKIIS